ncbi:MAG: alpha-hydroxy-acid oxidizing protein [Alphaproteobacteria bacterium]|nr:alpha-hydroxy-acid oxidizing protein [Alphaproteobacteria bacterium]
MSESPFQTLHEVVKAAKANLNKDLWDYLIGGTETETTLRRNRMAIESLAFRPRVLNDVTEVDCAYSLFGRKVRLPVILAPIGSLESLEAGGGATAMRAAAEFGVPLMLSSQCKPGLEATAAAAPQGLRIFQLYVRGGPEFEDDAVRRAKDNGFMAFAVTVDSAHYSRRERDIANRYVKPWRKEATGLNYQAGYSWARVRRFKDKHDIPLILKGIQTAEDAATAVTFGVNAIYVSNHGGRQIDHGQGTMDILPEVLDAVGGRVPVIVDGGFYRGADIVKAIAMGATAVGMGRMLGYGMAAAGQAGVVRILELLEEEVRICLGLMGCTSLSQVTRAHITRAQPVRRSHVHSAFPLLGEGY